MRGGPAPPFSYGFAGGAVLSRGSLPAREPSPEERLFLGVNSDERRLTGAEAAERKVPIVPQKKRPHPRSPCFNAYLRT